MALFNCPTHGLSKGLFCPSCQKPVAPEKTPEETQAEADRKAWQPTRMQV